MADEAQVASTPEAAPPEGQAPADGMTSEPTSSEATTPEVQESPTTEAPKTEGTDKVNLFKSEEFRKWQATQTAQVRAAQQRAAELERQLSESKKATMNDYERAEFEKNEAIQRAAQLEQQMEYQRLTQEKQADMQRLHEKTGIPIEQLESAETFMDAQEMAMDYLSSSLDEKAKARAEEITRAKQVNRTDTGGGQPAPVLTESEERLQNAKDSRNAYDYYAALLSE